MRTLVPWLAALVIGCSGPTPTQVQAPPPAAPPPPPSLVTCTDGATAKQEPTPQGLEHYCEKGAVKHGAFVRLYEDGTRAVEGAYEDGAPDGPWFWFHPNGNKSQKGAYKDGKAVGSWTWWYDDGLPKEEGDYLNGRKAGQWTVYHPSGRKAEEGMYQNDLKHGVWTYFADDDGNALTKSETWVSGQLQDAPAKAP